MLFKILTYLTPADLCSVECVCVDWRNLSKSSFNYMWWKICMNEWWNADSRPKGMSRNDAKQEWKVVYSQITPHNARNEKKVLKLKEPKIKYEVATNSNWDNLAGEEESDLAPSTTFKVEMRKYYKTHRAKPKGKRPVRCDKRLAIFGDDD